MTLGSGVESNIIIDIAFWVIAISCIISAIAVVQTRDLFRAGLFLVASFAAVAGMFVLLRAEFLAVVQVLIYVGAIAVLLLFAIMMTRDVEQGNPYNRLRVPALALVLLFFAATAYVVTQTEWNELSGAAGISAETGAAIDGVYANSVPELAGLLLRDYVLAFEVASVLLLAAVVGAIALVRER
ncbi:MAG: NADH-quinone oxidoreductase subunit L [SAR202 cluster bacterium]|nr:NADH-quinone oxidoreductase subunit L [SAR202 cluster bacterium]